MITPAYSPTATERVLPRLALDFTTGVLDSRVTVTRALNTATRTNSSGFIEAVNANLPRFDYDPVTLAPKGLLIEETRANLILQSDAFNDAAWTKLNSSVTQNAVASPDGTQNADKLVEDATNNFHVVNQLFTVSNTTAYTFSIFVEKGERTLVNIRLGGQTGNPYAIVDLNTGLKVAGSLNPVITQVANGFYRIAVTQTTNTTTLAPNIGSAIDTTVDASNRSVYQGDGTSGIYLYGAQLEAGAFATSYIPTTTTSLTRNADNVGMTGSNFSSWYTPNSAIFFSAALGAYNASSHNCAGSLANNANTQYLDYRLNDRFVGTARLTGNAGQLIQLQTASLNTRAKLGTSNNNTVRLAGAMNGNAVVASAIAGTFAGAEKLNIGRRFDGTVDYLNGWAVSVYSYPLTITDAELRAFSK